jgi:hypothetical protein
MRASATMMRGCTTDPSRAERRRCRRAPLVVLVGSLLKRGRRRRATRRNQSIKVSASVDRRSPVPAHPARHGRAATIRSRAAAPERSHVVVDRSTEGVRGRGRGCGRRRAARSPGLLQGKAQFPDRVLVNLLNWVLLDRGLGCERSGRWAKAVISTWPDANGPADRAESLRLLVAALVDDADLLAQALEHAEQMQR